MDQLVDVAVSSLLLLLLSLSARGDTGGYIVQVTALCPKRSGEPGTIWVLTDLPNASPFGICANSRHDFEKDSSSLKFLLPVYLSGNSSICIFSKKLGSNSYTMEVHVSEVKDIRTIREVSQVVTCNYEPVYTADTRRFKVVHQEHVLKDFPMKAAPAGDKKDFVIDLKLIDTNNESVQGAIRFGMMFRLVATISETLSEDIGFNVVSCQAVNEDAAYFIISDGCGDGFVIDEAVGFHSSGKTAASPYFAAFRLKGSNRIYFECRFIVCLKKCEGSSCSPQHLTTWNPKPKHDGGVLPIYVTGKSVMLSFNITRKVSVSKFPELLDFGPPFSGSHTENHSINMNKSLPSTNSSIPDDSADVIIISVVSAVCLVVILIVLLSAAFRLFHHHHGVLIVNEL